MKTRTKRILIGIYIFIFMVWLVPRLYYLIFELEGKNLVVFVYPAIPPPDDLDLDVEFEIYLNRELIYKVDSLEIYYNSVQKKVFPGWHTITVKVDSKEVKTFSFFVLLAKWVCIEYIGEKGIMHWTTTCKPRFM